MQELSNIEMVEKCIKRDAYIEEREAWQALKSGLLAQKERKVFFTADYHNNNFTPLSFTDVKKIMDGQPHNDNWVSRMPGFNRDEYEKYYKQEQEAD